MAQKYSLWLCSKEGAPCDPGKCSRMESERLLKSDPWPHRQEGIGFPVSRERPQLAAQRVHEGWFPARLPAGLAEGGQRAHILDSQKTAFFFHHCGDTEIGHPLRLTGTSCEVSGRLARWFGPLGRGHGMSNVFPL